MLYSGRHWASRSCLNVCLPVKTVPHWAAQSNAPFGLSMNCNWHWLYMTIPLNHTHEQPCLLTFTREDTSNIILVKGQSSPMSSTLCWINASGCTESQKSNCANYSIYLGGVLFVWPCVRFFCCWKSDPKVKREAQSNYNNKSLCSNLKSAEIVIHF